jgi:hypothetical protein
MTSKLIFAVAAVAGQLLFVGAQHAEARPTPPNRIVRDHRANPVPWALPKNYHNHNAGQGRRPR